MSDVNDPKTMKLIAGNRSYMEIMNQHGHRIECMCCERARATVPCRNGIYCAWCAENSKDAHAVTKEELAERVIEAAMEFYAGRNSKDGKVKARLRALGKALANYDAARGTP